MVLAATTVGLKGGRADGREVEQVPWAVGWCGRRTAARCRLPRPEGVRPEKSNPEWASG